jgi:hypothetical protein
MIVEVIGKVEQGYSNPYECLDENDQSFIVKGLPRSSQINEWVCANLATEFGLPIADYELVEIPEELYFELDLDAQIDLGCGPIFGSKKIPLVQWFEPETMHHIVTKEEKLKIFLFDYWVKNADRNSTNTNLLVSDQRIRVIDHNSAFDKKYTEGDVTQHIFYDQINNKKLNDLVFRAEISSQFEDILLNFDNIIGSIPEEWQYSDSPINTLKANVDFVTIENTLRRYTDDDFWFFV